MQHQWGRRGIGADGDAENLNQRPGPRWEDMLSPCEVTPGKSPPCWLSEMQKSRLFCNSRGLSYPSTKFLNGAHGEIAYSHLNNSKMAEPILLKLSPRIPLGAKPCLANFSPNGIYFRIG